MNSVHEILFKRAIREQGQGRKPTVAPLKVGVCKMKNRRTSPWTALNSGEATHDKFVWLKKDLLTIFGGAFLYLCMLSIFFSDPSVQLQGIVASYGAIFGANVAWARSFGVKYSIQF